MTVYFYSQAVDCNVKSPVWTKDAGDDAALPQSKSALDSVEKSLPVQGLEPQGLQGFSGIFQPDRETFGAPSPGL